MLFIAIWEKNSNDDFNLIFLKISIKKIDWSFLSFEKIRTGMRIFFDK